MTMAWIWTGMAVLSILCGLATGRGDLVAAAAVEGAQAAVELCVSIAGMLCLWTGVMEIMRRSGLAEGLSRLCARALAVTVGANLTFQLLQLACARWLRSLNTQVSFPLLSMAFVLGALLLSRLIREGKQLKDDNDLFV